MKLFSRDKAEHIAAMIPLFCLVAAASHWVNPIAAAATAVTIAGLHVEIREGEAYSWYKLRDYKCALTRAFHRALGLQATVESKDSLLDWLTPATIAWLIYIITLIIPPA